MLSSFEILEDALFFYKENFKTFFIITFPAFLFSLAYAIYSPSLSMGGKAGFALAILAPIGIWKNLALFYTLKHHKEDFHALDAYNKTFDKIPSFLLLCAIMAFTLFGALLFFVIPLIIFVVSLSLASYVYFFENLQGFEALAKSTKYVKGKWGNAAAKITWLMIFGLFVNGILTFGTQMLLAKTAAITVTTLFLECFIMPLNITYMFFVYRSFKTLHDAETPAPVDPLEEAIALRTGGLKAMCALGVLFVVFLLFWIGGNYTSISTYKYKFTQEQKEEFKMLTD